MGEGRGAATSTAGGSAAGARPPSASSRSWRDDARDTRLICFIGPRFELPEDIAGGFLVVDERVTVGFSATEDAGAAEDVRDGGLAAAEDGAGGAAAGSAAAGERRDEARGLDSGSGDDAGDASSCSSAPESASAISTRSSRFRRDRSAMACRAAAVLCSLKAFC